MQDDNRRYGAGREVADGPATKNTAERPAVGQDEAAMVGDERDATRVGQSGQRELSARGDQRVLKDG